MGPISTEHLVQTTAADMDMKVGPQFASPFYVVSVLYKRVTAGAADMILSAIWGDQEFIIDKVTGSTVSNYVFPNARVPYPVALPNGCQIRFKTSGVAGAESRAAIIQWAQG
jgi:hypothetical protein